MSSDPLLRATADGDTACPDGQALAALGRAVRQASTVPRAVDLRAQVLTRLEALGQLSAEDDFDDEAIDRFYDGDGRGPAELVNLSNVIRNAAQAPHPIALSERVRNQLHGSLRFKAQRAIDLGSRWRIWSTVVAGHVAALLAISVYQFHTNQPAPEPAIRSVTASGGDAGMRGQVGSPVQPTPKPLPAVGAWAQIPGTSIDLFAPRRSDSTRTAARNAAAMADTAPVVAGGLRWVLAAQDATSGRFGSLSTGDQALAVHSLALLTLLGEGLDDRERAQAVRHGLTWLVEQQHVAPIRDTAAAGLSLLALVEGALLTGDAELRTLCTRALASSESVIPAQPGPAGLGGYLLLAYETANQAGLSVPGRALETARRNLGRALPDIEHDDSGRIGLAAFARLILGRAANPSTPLLLSELGRMHRLPHVDPNGRIDPFGWFFATLAAHEAGGPLWNRWNEALHRTVLPALAEQDGLRHLSAANTRFAEAMADGELFATSAALLELQVPYRYLPLTR